LERLEYYKHDKHFPNNVNLLIVDDGSRPDDYIKVKSLDDGLRIKVISTGRNFYQNFSLSVARNLGAQHADGEFIFFYDADLAPYPGFFNDLIREIEINEMHMEATNFLMCPVIYLSDKGYHKYQSTPPELRRQYFISAMLRGDTELIEKFSSGTSAIVVRRHYYLTRGGSDTSFQGWGFEDYELITRLMRRSRQFPLPENWLSCDGNFMTINKYSGWKAAYRLHGDWLANKGIYLFHIPHVIEQSYHANKDANFKLLQRRMEENTKNIGEPPALADMNAGRSLVLAKNPFTTGRDFLPYLGECIYSNNLDFTNQRSFAKYVKENRISRVVFSNPYANEKSLMAYNWCRKNNFSYLVCERGALPDSVFHDPNGFLSDSISYSTDQWDRELNDEEVENVINYISEIRHGISTLEKQAGREDIHQIRRKLGIDPSNKVLLVPFQQPNDTVVRHFSGTIKGFENFYDLVASLPEKLGEEWKVLYKKHPIEDDLTAIPRAIDVSDYNINDLMEICDAVALINSGTGILGMMFGKPVFILGECWYSHAGLNFTVQNSDMLCDALKGDLSVDFDRICRFIHYLKYSFYSFGVQHQRRVRYDDGSPITATTGIDYYELRGFTPNPLFIKRSYRPIARNSPLFDRYKPAGVMSTVVKTTPLPAPVGAAVVSNAVALPSTKVGSAPPASHRSHEQHKAAKKRKLKERPIRYVWDAIKKRF